MDGLPAFLEGEEYYIEVSVVRKGMTQQAAQGCSRQQQPMGSLDCAISQQEAGHPCERFIILCVFHIMLAKILSRSALFVRLPGASVLPHELRYQRITCKKKCGMMEYHGNASFSMQRCLCGVVPIIWG